MSIYTVSQLNRYVAFQLKADRNLQGIFVRGEIADFVCHPRSGHCYFTLHDGDTAMKAVMFARFAEHLKFMPGNGMTVIAAGSVSVYERDGVYQLAVTDLQADGQGAAQLAKRLLVQALSAKGYFNEARKRPLPEMPHKIGVVTAPGGAALQDILHILARRYPIGEVVVFPALVQGVDAPQSVASAIQEAGQSDCDVLIVGRGGGSDEDLSAFDTEQVATAIFACPIPVVSAVGHETDVTIADCTADLRASTPSAAAELVAPDASLLLGRLGGLQAQMRDCLLRRLDTLSQTLAEQQATLARCSVAGQLSRMDERRTQLDARLTAAMQARLEKSDRSLLHQMARLDCLSPLRVLTRGYALVYRENALILTTDGISAGDTLQIRLAKGSLTATVEELTEE